MEGGGGVTSHDLKQALLDLCEREKVGVPADAGRMDAVELALELAIYELVCVGNLNVCDCPHCKYPQWQTETEPIVQVLRDFNELHKKASRPEDAERDVEGIIESADTGSAEGTI